nr:MAG TPA: hypothetical protein [Caudoviricetes sp.]DAX47236.1 MAG TPA: hypothetical protein [Caudoviricetes sp.]
MYALTVRLGILRELSWKESNLPYVLHDTLVNSRPHH